MKELTGRPFAVFDIDGTLYRWQLFHELVQQLALDRAIPEETYRSVDANWHAWRAGKMPFEAYEQTVVDTLIEYLPRIPVPAFEQACDDIVVQSQHKTHFYTRQLLERLKNEGYVTIAITGSQQELIERFGQHYGLDITVGALYERKDNQFTGRVIRPTIGHKHAILQDIIDEHTLRIEDSYAIGDSDGDIPILQMVAHPIAFNPSATLLNHAQTAGWPVVVERKNIAYCLEKHDHALVLAETIVY